MVLVEQQKHRPTAPLAAAGPDHPKGAAMLSSHLAIALADARIADIHRDVRINRQLPDASGDSRPSGAPSLEAPVPRSRRSRP
jgi:hypothetical protein